MKTLDPVIFNIRRDFILQHARHLFSSKGYAETSMDDIAQACSLQKASLYHYFESKQKLLQELVDWGCAHWARRVEEFGRGKTLAETLELVAWGILKDFDEPASREFARLVHFESHKNPAILKALKESPAYDREGLFGVFATHLPGLARNTVAGFITQFMGALLHFGAITKLQGENLCFEQLTDEEYVRQLVDTFCNGIGPLLSTLR